MKKIFTVATIGLSLFFTTESYASQNQLTDFNNRLDRIYGQANTSTTPQQVLYGTLEFYAAYKINSLISKVDRLSVKSIQAELNLLNNGRTSLTPAQVAARKLELKKQLRVIEGSIAKKLGRGVTRIVVRGTQLFLVYDIATRVYVLNMIEKDPGFFPAYALTCSETIVCDYAVDQVMRAEIEARRELEAPPEPYRPVPAPPSSVAPATPATIPAPTQPDPTQM